jgi:hypothetical protein
MVRKCNVNSKFTKLLSHTADCITDSNILTLSAVFQHELNGIAI